MKCSCMVLIAIVSDAHLLMQAEWLEDESKITAEGNEVLENFERAIDELKKEKPEAVFLAGDIFDYRTKSQRRVAHREGEKYMIRIRAVLDRLADELNCKIYALKGNHDSEPVLRSTEKALKGKFVYCGYKTVKIGDLNAFFLDSHYLPGLYDIPLEQIPGKGYMLIMHESAPLWGVPAPSEENFRSICKRFEIVFNGHMHSFQPKAVGIPNLYMIPAFIPSREIKNNWMVKYKYPSDLEPEIRETPFGFILLKDGEAVFRPYNPLQVIVRAEVIGERPEDFINGIHEIYGAMSQREDKNRLRVWVATNADPITIDRIFWPTIREYSEILTMDVLCERPKPKVGEAGPAIEFGAKAFTREELCERVLESIKDGQREMTRRIFSEIFTAEYLRSSRPDERAGFRKLLEIISKDYKVSDAFLTRAWEMAKGREQE